MNPKASIRVPVSVLVIGGMALAFGGYRLGLDGQNPHVVTRERESPRLETRVAEPAPTREANDRFDIEVSNPDPSAPLAHRWEEFFQDPASPLRNQKMADALEVLARSDPLRAMSIAAREPGLRLRQVLTNAALRGWASTDADAAAGWVLAASPDQLESGADGVLSGAAVDPEAACQAAARFCATDPGRASGYGRSLIDALGKRGAFERAAQFAGAAAPDHRAFLIHTAYQQWGQYEPRGALELAGRIADPEVRTQALQAVVAGWATEAPAQVAEYGMQMADGPARSLLLAEVLPRWAPTDPAGLAEWINRRTPHASFDAGVAAVATLSSVMEDQPETAAIWAGSITEPHLRETTLRTVIDSWIRQNPAAARIYLETSASLPLPERQRLLSELSRRVP